MELVTLYDWVYPTTPIGTPVYAPIDGVGRHTNSFYSTPTAPQANVYRPNELVENYDSLIWKESFRTNGEFELKTHDIAATMAQLPKGTLVSLLDSEEVCIVTTHHIGVNEQGQDVLTIKGKNLLTHILENRPTWAYQKNAANPSAVNAERVNIVFRIPDHLAFILWAAIVFPHAEGGYPTSNKPFELPENIIVPHTFITQSNMTSKGDYYQTEWPPPLEMRINSVNEVLELDQRFGVRTIRPTNKPSVTIFSPIINSLRGEGNTETWYNPTQLIFDVYRGIDRTTGNARVVFRQDAGDITTSEYLSSIELHKGMVSVHSDVDNTKTPFTNVQPATLSRLVWVGDGKTDSAGNPITIPTATLDARKYQAGINFRMGEVGSTVSVKDSGLTAPAEARLQADGLKYLKENANLDLLTAEISPQTQFKYKQHYNLGDVVLVQGKYGTAQKMVISEYTRTSDSNGVSGFPTLIKWEES